MEVGKDSSCGSALDLLNVGHDVLLMGVPHRAGIFSVGLTRVLSI